MRTFHHVQEDFPSILALLGLLEFLVLQIIVPGVWSLGRASWLLLASPKPGLTLLLVLFHQAFHCNWGCTNVSMIHKYLESLALFKHIYFNKWPLTLRFNVLFLLKEWTLPLLAPRCTDLYFPCSKIAIQRMPKPSSSDWANLTVFLYVCSNCCEMWEHASNMILRIVVFHTRRAMGHCFTSSGSSGLPWQRSWLSNWNCLSLSDPVKYAVIQEVEACLCCRTYRHCSRKCYVFCREEKWKIRVFSSCTLKMHVIYFCTSRTTICIHTLS